MSRNIVYNEKTVYSTFKNLPTIKEQVSYTSDFSAIDVIIDMEMLINQAKLTELQELVFNKYFIEGYTLQEIAKDHGYTHQAVFNFLKRSKEKINGVLRKWGEI